MSFCIQNSKPNITKLNERVRLGQEEFTQLVEGKQVTIGNVDIILADIGYDLMLSIIEKLREDLYSKK